MATHLDIKDIQLPQPHTRTPITSNCHHQTRWYQSHPIAKAIHVGTKHIKLSPPYTWAPATSNYYRHTRWPSTTHNCQSHTRGHKPRPTCTTKLVGTNHIQLSCTHTWAQTTSYYHGHTRKHQTHSTVTTIHVGASHIQLLPPHAWAPNHTQLPQPHTRAQTTSNWHHHTRGH